tara:strand:+ start:842 stop:3484 length:2643 start_codon:yes stop_codon:yes gene_type:complete
MLDKYYQPGLVEEKIYKQWEEDGDFNAPVDSKNKHYSIVIPPPNVTGNLHMGHALNNTLQDILIRFHRMRGRDVLWQPGTDHAGIATEMVVERELKKQKIKKTDLSREKFIEHVWKWKDLSGNKIINQLKRLGCSCDWSRERFTLDEGLSQSVRHVFVKLYKDGLVYKDKRLSNWDPKLKTTISDLEVIQKEVKGTLWYINYEIENGDGHITIATTRPETMLGDTAIAVHPEDKRFTDMIGKFAILPIVEKRIPIVADEYVKMDQGSGAVKITPAHDFNDYELGKRHALEIINIFNENAELNENCPQEYQGLDRYTAREKIISELKEKDVLSKEEENLHTVPYGDRSGEVIEPFLTDQWFVDAEKLSIEAINNVKNGNTKFIPSNWDKVYFDWMENIQPWCVSRQLIWGHQIPAWYGPDGNIFVEETMEEAHISAKKYYGKDVKLVQENDVLDTWFSSALWPFSTLGWPEETAELEKYYPTSALVTGFDIIFFWVARMMMMGLYFTKKVPFNEVYVHALVRDEKGQKMSKSKGNVIDPLVLMDEFGADALRMALCSMAAQGRDIKLSKQRIEGYKNFINKIWNAVKLCELNNCSYQEIDSKNIKNIFNKWILSEYENCRNKTQFAIENYRFNEAANELYKFTWNIFCDWYLEFSKVIYLSKNDTDINETRNITSYVLSNILIMFHPIMPFFTEHLWHKASNILKNDTTKINKSEWPKGISVDEKDNIKIKVLLELISSIRSTRSEMNVPANAVIDINYSKISNELGAIFDQYKETIQSLTRSKSITEKNFSKDEGMVQVIFNDGLIYLSLKGIIDFEQEKNRLQKSLSKIQKEMNKIDIKLKSENFTQNAPEEIIDEQKNRYKEYELSMKKIEVAIKSLG